MTGPTDPPLPTGYQFDYINAEVIERDLQVENGMFTLPNGTQYRILVLPKIETMRPELLRKIRDLVAAGGVVLGPPQPILPACRTSRLLMRQLRNLLRNCGKVLMVQRYVLPGLEQG